MKDPIISLVGVGGVGALLLPALREFQPNLVYIIDHDVYEERNVERQPNARGNANEHKVSVLADLYNSESLPIEAVPTRIQDDDAFGYLLVSDLIIAAVDNNNARNFLYKFCAEQKKPLIYCANENTSGQCHLLYPDTFGTPIDPWIIHPELWNESESSPESCSRNPLDQTYATNTLTAAMVVHLLRLNMAVGFKPVTGISSAIYYSLKNIQHKLPYA
jgi:molybdopterin/thiamine biosynthesis adenylyltransferase